MKKKPVFFFLITMCIYPLYSQLEITPENVTRFMQAYVPSLMSRYDVAGMTISLVYQGKTIYTAGFGLADVEKSIPVDPAKTLFRAGSVSKLFIWTALMQLYEQGKLDLQADINSYLQEYAIEKKFDKPVTVLDLMAHTAGFEDNLIGLFVKDPRLFVPFDEYMKAERLKRIAPPGQYIAYSNYSTCLGGLIVEKISGQSFNDYVEEHILKPLGMQYSTFIQPLPTAFTEQMATGYVGQAGTYMPQDFEFVSAAPAGALSTTAGDMAHFMLMHLAKGQYLDKQILRPETASFMQTTSFEPAPGINGFAHGFMELGLPGLRIIGHGGDTIYFHSMCLLFPEQNLGLFYSTNTAGGAVLNFDLFWKFLTTFFSLKTGSEYNKIYLARSGGGEDISVDLSGYVGNYRGNRRSESNFLKMVSLTMGASVALSQDKQALDITDFTQQRKLRCVPVAKNVFQAEDGFFRYAFLEDSRGGVNALILNAVPAFTLLKAPFYEQIPFNAFILVFTLLAILYGMILRPTGLLVFLSKEKVSGLALVARVWGSGLIGLTIIGTILSALTIGSDFIFTKPSPLPFFFLYVIFFMTVGMAIFCILAWKNKFWKPGSRINYTIVTAGYLLFMWFAVYWEFVF